MNSTQLRGYLTGLILGDGHIDKGVTKRSFEIKTINEEWANKIFNDIKDSTNFQISLNEFSEYIGEDGTHHKKYYSVKIKAHPYFNKKYNYFYDDKRHRRITKESLNWLNLEGLANWYMSDGYICLVGKTKGNIRDRRVDLCTDRYSYSDVLKIQEYLLNEWGWETNIIQRKTNSKIMYRIRFNLKSAQDFLYKISPYVVSSFNYKLNLEYDYRPKWMSDEYYNLMLKIQKCEPPTVNTEGEDIV